MKLRIRSDFSSSRTVEIISPISNFPCNRDLDLIYFSSESGSSYDNLVQLKIKSDSSSSRTVEVVSPELNIPHNHATIPVSPEYTKSILAVKEFEESWEKEKKVNRLSVYHQLLYLPILANEINAKTLCI